MGDDNDKISSSRFILHGDNDKVDPYWWEQGSTSSSRNLIDSANGGMWDSLFQEKISDASEINSDKINEGKCNSENSSLPLPSLDDMDRTYEKKFDKLSFYDEAIPQNNSSSEALKPSPPRKTENTGVSTRKSSNSIDSHATVHLDYDRLKAEHRKLKKYFENAYESRYKTPPISETVRRLNRREPVVLDLYKSHQEKLALLDATMEQCDWDGIITVLLFIRRTLSNPLFRQCLMEKPKAAQHYITYLRETGDTSELIDTLFGLGQTSEAAMVEFVTACKWSDPQRQLNALRNCFLSGFSHPQLSKERKYLQEWIALLETHLRI